MHSHVNHGYFSPNNNEQLQVEEIFLSIALVVLFRITYLHSGYIPYLEHNSTICHAVRFVREKVGKVKKSNNLILID